MIPGPYETPKSSDELEWETATTKQVEAALQWARKSVEVAKRTQNELLSNMTHEMRTPMYGIVGMLDLALETNLDATQREYLLTAKRSAGLMLRLINDIFDFSKIEAGKIELEEVVFNLPNLIELTLDPLITISQEKPIEIYWAISPECPRILVGDAGRLRQVLSHLVGNAVKFTERGEISLEVFPESRIGHDIALHFCVTDSGIGIAQDRMEEIFEPFVQLDGSSTRKYGGVGLGLSICKSLVELMGGHLWCQSRLGKGTIFHFTVQFKLPSEREITSEKKPDTKDFRYTEEPLLFPRWPSSSNISRDIDLVPLPHSSKIFDFHAGLQRSGTRNDRLIMTIEGFITYAPTLIKALKDMTLQDEIYDLEQTAADLREVANYVGADKLSDELFRFQLAVRRGDTDSFDTLRKAIEKAFDTFKEAFFRSNRQELLSETLKETR